MWTRLEQLSTFRTFDLIEIKALDLGRRASIQTPAAA
jgi:hypothetical protein